MTRIELKDEDIFVVYGDDEVLRSDTGTCDIMSQKGLTDEQAEQLKKQILEDYEFANKKKDIVKIIEHEMQLESQVKVLQEEVKDNRFALRLTKDELQKYKQFAESVKSYLDMVEISETHPKERTVKSVTKRIQQLIEGLK